MALELDEASVPATVSRRGNIVYNMTGGEKIQIRYKAPGTGWIEELEYTAPDNIVTKAILSVYIDEV